MSERADGETTSILPPPRGWLRVSRRGWTLLAVALGLVAGGAVVVGTAQVQRREKLLQGERRQSEAMEEFAEGKRLVRQGRWREAAERFRRAGRISPGLVGLEAYRVRAAVEEPNEEWLRSSEEALARGDFAASVRSLRRVTADSQMRARAAQLEGQLRAEVDRTLERARALRDQGERSEAGFLVRRLLEAFPDHPGAREAARMLEEASAARPAPVSLSPPPWKKAMERFQTGDLGGARDELARCRDRWEPCRALVADLETFDSLQSRVDELGPRRLGELFEAERRLSGGERTRLSGPARARWVETWFKRAQTLRQAGQWGRAIQAARRVLEIDSVHPGAAGIVREGEERARELFLSAYAMKEIDLPAALERLGKVAESIPAEHELHQKANRLLERLRR